MDICHLKNAEFQPKHPKYKGRVVLRGDNVKDNSGSYVVCTEQGSSASQMTAAKVMDIVSRPPRCEGQAADAVSLYIEVKMEDAPSFQSEGVQIFGFVYRNTKWPKSWSSMEDPVVPLERNLYGHPLASFLWERPFEEVLVGTWMGKSTELGMSVYSTKTRIFIRIRGHKHGWKKAECGSHVEEIDETRWFWRTIMIL